MKHFLLKIAEVIYIISRLHHIEARTETSEKKLCILAALCLSFSVGLLDRFSGLDKMTATSEEREVEAAAALAAAKSC